MAAPVGNQYWRARTKHGRDKLFSTPEILWEACCEYFDWVEQNPLNEYVIFQGKIAEETIPKIRAMTIQGLCLFLDIDDDTWAEYKKRKDFTGIVTRAERIIYQQKFSGAAAGLLNANIIARDLGLADKKEHTGADGGAIQTITRTIIDPAPKA